MLKILTLLVITSISSSFAQTTIFSDGSPIKANEINANFKQNKKIKYLATLTPGLPSYNNKSMGNVVMPSPVLSETFGNIALISGNILGIKPSLELKGKYMIKAVIQQSYYNNVSDSVSAESTAMLVVKSPSNVLIKQSDDIRMNEAGYQINSGSVHHWILYTILDAPTDNYAPNIELHFSTYGRNSNGTVNTTGTLGLNMNKVMWEVEKID